MRRADASGPFERPSRPSARCDGSSVSATSSVRARRVAAWTPTGSGTAAATHPSSRGRLARRCHDPVVMARHSSTVTDSTRAPHDPDGRHPPVRSSTTCRGYASHNGHADLCATIDSADGSARSTDRRCLRRTRSDPHADTVVAHAEGRATNRQRRGLPGHGHDRARKPTATSTKHSPRPRSAPPRRGQSQHDVGARRARPRRALTRPP